MDALSSEVTDAEPEDVRTIGRKGTRRGPGEVLTRERRRTWTLEQKRSIVTESLGPGLTPTEVARKYAISSGLLYSWRQQVFGGQVGVVTAATPSLARVELAPGLQTPDGMSEIVLPNGTLVRVDAGVDGRALRRVLSALDDQ